MTERRVVAIHQPNFFPWLGWFAKAERADIFILLDDVQFQKKGGTWANRVGLLVNGEQQWITMPIARAYHGTRLVSEIEIDESKPWREKLTKTIRMSYSHASHFDDVEPVVSELIANPARTVVAYNELATAELASRVGIDTGKFVKSSELSSTGTATERLISLIRDVGGNAYLSGGGAERYQDEQAFAEAGLDFVRQGFEPHPYPQPTPEFVPGLSMIDALMNCGFEGTRPLLEP